MTYFGFLARFLLVPLLILGGVTLWDTRRGKAASGFADGPALWTGIGLMVLLALVYTTPWDNYLVARGVWGYRPDLVAGVVLGWVPVEEYTFFILETILAGLWWGFLARRLAPPGVFRPSPRIIRAALAAVGLAWLGSLAVLLSGWERGAYLGLILAWALPVMGIQLAFGADLLWHHRRLVALAILPLTGYLSVADGFALASGTWAISPVFSTGARLGPLPLEEAIFFLVTVVIITWGLTLALAAQSKTRWAAWLTAFRRLSRRRELD